MIEAMTTFSGKRLFAAALVAAALTSAAASAAPRVVQLKGGDDMKYSVNKIQATPGEELKVVLTVTSAMAKDAMAHNFVLLDPSTDINTFVTRAAVARKTAFIPAAMQDKILAHSPLAGNGETVEVTFKAPTTPGTYVYLCTFPGHYAGGMQGQLIVK
jgi:azurin